MFFRYSQLEERIDAVENALKLRNLSKTRWTARAESIRAVWISYEQVKDALEAIKTSDKFDNKTKAAASNLGNKMESCDFIISIMFMTNTKQMTEALQAEDLNIVDAMTIIRSTVCGLQRINGDSLAMDDLIEAGIQFTDKLGGNAHAEFNRKHRARRRPARIDDHPEAEAELGIVQFYRREFKEVLDTMITQFGDNLAVCLQAVRPLAKVLQPPLQEANLDDISELVQLFPPDTTIDPFALESEFSNFLSHAQLTNQKLDSMSEAAKFSEKWKSAFPLTNKAYRLLLTAPVTVAKDERSFSRLKLIKTYLRTTMTDSRLESLILMSCKKDLTDSIDTDYIAKVWAELKSRRIRT